MATGSGKTKVLSLALVWSFYHKLSEPESGMARNFLVIAPNNSVYVDQTSFERFKPESFRELVNGFRGFKGKLSR
jgi:hypothetical protein